MAGIDLADLDRSALQYRIAQHEQHEDSLGSLPDLVDSMAEGMSSYPATSSNSGANTSNDGDPSMDRLEGRGKENQSPANVSRKSVGGKTDVSSRVISFSYDVSISDTILCCTEPHHPSPAQDLLSPDPSISASRVLPNPDSHTGISPLLHRPTQRRRYLSLLFFLFRGERTYHFHPRASTVPTRTQEVGAPR